MQHLEVSSAVQHIYIYIYVIRRLKVNISTIRSTDYLGDFSHISENCKYKGKTPCGLWAGICGKPISANVTFLCQIQRIRHKMGGANGTYGEEKYLKGSSGETCV